MKTLLLALVIALPSASAIAATATAEALQIVEAAIAINKQSDLDFGTASQGDAAKPVAADTTETAENASFLVTGEANKAYTIALPADGDVIMKKDGIGGSADSEIAVNGFESFPLQGANGVLDGSGQESLYVGATRDALLATQESGSYTDTFTVTVFY